MKHREALPSVWLLGAMDGVFHEKWRCKEEYSLPHECYVIQIDGRLNSTYRRFVDALRAGLKLKDRFPDHDIKVRAMQASKSTADVKQGFVLH